MATYYLENVMIDHRKAAKHRLACRYVLGELPEYEREDFERHLFECAGCAQDVRALLAISLNADEMLAEMPLEQAPVTAGMKRHFRWLETFWHWSPQPAYLMVPIFALLLWTGLATRELVTVRSQLAPQNIAEFTLRPDARGEETAVAMREGAAFFVLAADVPGAVHDLKWQIRSADSNVSLLEGIAPLPSRGSTLRLLIPASKYKSGSYVLSIRENISSPEPPAEALYGFRMH